LRIEYRPLAFAVGKWISITAVIAFLLVLVRFRGANISL